MNILARAFAAISLTIVAGVPGSYAGYLGGGANSNAFVIAPGAQKPVPLRQNGDTTIVFKTTRANTLVVVTYNAECAATGDGWVSIMILVDGRKTEPSVEGDFALCTARGSTPIPAAVSRQAVIVVPQAGSHKVRVIAVVYATKGQLDDSSTVIQD